MNTDIKSRADHRPVNTKKIEKFEDPDITAKGEMRAKVALSQLDTLWINTGTLCNIECASCYIESSPTNDRLVYMSADEVSAFLDEAEKVGTREIAITGGEPFMNPDILPILDDALARGFEVLVLTNAMQPMQRPRVQAGLLDLVRKFRNQLTLRVSLDHYTKSLHETERGLQTWDKAIAGLNWLAKNKFKIAIAGRTCWNETDEGSRKGYATLIAQHNWSISPSDPQQLMLLPEMDGSHDVPEITTACWGILNKNPNEMMCATSRMVVKRKGADKPVVLPCTLLPYDKAFEMGETLAEAARSDGGMFDQGAVKLCHSHCAKFCVLGGGSCS
ncbi:MAG: radical SAM protein [Hyphomicrobiaceae bacterium]